MTVRMEIIRCNPNVMWGRKYWRCIAVNSSQNTRIEFLSIHPIELHTFITVEVNKSLVFKDYIKLEN